MPIIDERLLPLIETLAATDTDWILTLGTRAEGTAGLGAGQE